VTDLKAPRQGEDMTEDHIERLIAALDRIEDALSDIAARLDENNKLIDEMTYIDEGRRILRVDTAR
jgi:hypothetical protein